MPVRFSHTARTPEPMSLIASPHPSGRATAGPRGCPWRADPLFEETVLDAFLEIENLARRTVFSRPSVEGARSGKPDFPGTHDRAPKLGLTIRTPASTVPIALNAEVAELVDALASGASACKGVWVRVPSSAPSVGRGSKTASSLLFSRFSEHMHVSVFWGRPTAGYSASAHAGGGTFSSYRFAEHPWRGPLEFKNPRAFPGSRTPFGTVLSAMHSQRCPWA